MTEEPKPDRINRMIEIARKAAGGDFSSRIRTSGKDDEIDRLADAINQLVDLMSGLITVKSRTETSLRESEQRFRSLVEMTSDFVWEINSDGVYTYASPKVKDLLGYEPEQVLGKKPFDFMPEDEAERISALFKDIGESHRSFAGLQNVNLHKDGRKIVLETNGVPILDARGNLLGYHGIDRDITDRKQAEDALRDSLKRFNDIIDFLPDATFVIDSYGKVIAWNRAMEEMTSVPKADMIGKGNYEYAVPFYGQARPLLIDLVLLPDDDFEKNHYENIYWQSDTLFAESYVPLIYKGKDTHLWGTASRLRDASGNIIGAIESIRDITDRKRAEEALQDSEKLLNDILDGSPIPQFVIGMDHRIIKWNKAIEKYTGIRAEDVIGTDQQWVPFYKEKRPIMADLLVDGDLEKLPQWYAGKYAKSQLVEGAYEGTNFFPGLGKDGKWLYFTASPIKNSDGNIVGALETLEDVTERKHAEKAMSRLNRKLRAISNCNQTLMRAEDEQSLLNEICRIVCEEAGYFVTWVGYAENDDARTVRPVAWAGVEDKNLANINISWADTERGRGPSGTAIRSGKTAYIQDFTTDPGLALWREDALQRGYRSSISLPLKDENANSFGVFNIYSTEPDAFTPDEIRLMEELAADLAFGINVLRTRIERRRAEETLKEKESFLSSIIENIPDMIFIKDADKLKLTRINKSVENLLGYKRDDLIGKSDYDFFPEEQADFFSKKDRMVLETGQPYEIAEEPIDTMSGRRLLHTIKIPIPDKNGKPAYLLGISEDITERKQAENEQAKLQAQLSQAQKMESVGRLAGGVAHDFNNMLGVIIGYTDLTLKKVDLSESIFANLQHIRKAAESSADLTRQLLAFARKQTIAPKVLDLNETVESMLKILRRLIGEDIDLAWLPAKNLWPVKVDPSQIDQILANLCVNARDAISGVGKVTIETGIAVFDETYCARHPMFVPGDYLLLAVSDDGCGMDKDILDKLFEPFFTTKGMGKGTGLGLATVYGIVKQNNGFINVYSEPGQGTTFKIYLPRHKGKTGEMQMEGRAEPARGHETVLLVEDEQAILDMTTMMLQGLGYTVLPASTPNEAIHMAEAHPGEIHMLMTDVIMPGMNGRDLAKSLLSRYPHLKSLFMSGYTANVIAHHGVLEKGVNFIQKPFSMQDMAAKLREILDNK